MGCVVSERKVVLLDIPAGRAHGRAAAMLRHAEMLREQGHDVHLISNQSPQHIDYDAIPSPALAGYFAPRDKRESYTARLARRLRKGRR